MGKVLLVYVLFLIVVSTAWEIKVKREYTSKILSNVMLISLSQRAISVTAVIVNIIVIACNKKGFIIIVYKVKISSPLKK